MRIWHSWFRFCLLGLAGLLAVMRASALTAAQHGNQLLVDDQPVTLTFARGCTQTAMLEAYRACGFNTLLVRVDALGPSGLEDLDALMTAAEAQGLYLLIELTNGNWSYGQRINPANERYAGNVTYYLDEVIPRFKAHPRLLGWVISTVEEDRLVSNVQDFADFLMTKYGTVERVDAAWSYQDPDTRTWYRSHVPSIRVLTEQNALRLTNSHSRVQQLVREDIQEYKQTVAARDDEFRVYLRTRYGDLDAVAQSWGFRIDSWDKIGIDVLLQRQQQHAWESPMMMLDLARYRAGAQRAVLEWWVQQLRKRDAGHLLFAGAQYSYRTLISLPPSVNGVLTDCYPGMAEVDTDAQNPHAIDIARRGNRFIVLAGVLARNIEPHQLGNALYAAAMHGAAGICVVDWPMLAGSGEHAAIVAAVLQDFARRRLLGSVPAPHIAIVYSPYLPGPNIAGRPLYGFLPRYISSGPGMLFFSLRHGSCYGQFDYLAPEDLPEVPLGRYRTLLLLSALDLPLPAQEALSRFTETGGVVLADMGAGTVQANGNFHFLPPALQLLFGVQNVPGRVQSVRRNLEVYRADPRFPRLLQGMRTNGLMQGYAVTQITRCIPLPGTDLLFSTVATTAFQRPTPRPRRPLRPQPMEGLFISDKGKGYALYAPFPLYEFWMSGNLLFDEFHRDLFAAGARVVLDRPVDCFPARASLATYEDGSIAVWTRDQVVPVARMPARTGEEKAPRQLYQVTWGRCELSSEGTTFRFTQPGYHLAHPLPIYLQPTPFPVTAEVTRLTPDALVLDFDRAPANAGIPVTVQVGDGMYPVLPGSRHQVNILTETGKRQVEVQADEHGVLNITLPDARCRVLLAPPSSPGDVVPQGDSSDTDSHEHSVTPVPDAG